MFDARHLLWRKKHRIRFATRAFWAGIVAIALDAVVNYLVTTLAGLWPFILHFAAIWFLFLGLKASRLHAQRRAEGKAP